MLRFISTSFLALPPGRLTRYASAGRTAEARKPIAPIKAKRAEWRPRLEESALSLVILVEFHSSGTNLLKWSADHATATVTTYATAYGGTVMSCALRLEYPKPAVIAGVNSERLEKGVEMPK